jgi:chemotaxis protein CheD
VTDPEIFVGMGELAVTANAGDVLTSIGLGSCVGIALLDSRRHAVGLAHAMFPLAPEPHVEQPGRYADTAIRALLAALAELGSVPASLRAVVTGGARMFNFERASTSDIGARNVVAAHEALAAAGIEVCAEATGGSKGRSIRIRVADGVVRLREAGNDRELYRPAEAGERERAAR